MPLPDWLLCEITHEEEAVNGREGDEKRLMGKRWSQEEKVVERGMRS